MINGSTKIVGLIGHPVEHSFSPPMHNAAFEELGLDYAYVPFNVCPENLKSAILGAKSLNIKGFNVTIPHKINVMKYLDKLDPIAKLIGAVNTIDFKEMKGYNTDGIGCIKAIGEVTSIKDKNIVVAGAGGASRAISFYLARENPQSIHILNRDINKAKSLAEDVKNSKLTDNVDFDSIDKIVGYISRGNGVIVHTKNCYNLRHMDDRIIDVSWNKEQVQKYKTNISIVSEKLENVLLDIITKTNNLNINITKVDTKQKENETIFNLIVEVDNVDTLNKYMTLLKQNSNIISVERAMN